MSKLYVEYLKLKSENINKLYLFKSGIFILLLRMMLKNCLNYLILN